MGAVSLGLAALGGCKLGPDYERPVVLTPATMGPVAAVSSEAGTTRFTGEAPWDRWWEVFGDAQLDQLVASARAQNQGLQAALARVQIARAMNREATAPLFPSFSLNGQYANEKQSLSAFAIPGIPDVRPFQRTDFFQGTADMAYELDLWGRVRRGLEVSDAQLVASDEDRKNVEITLVADVTQAYFDLGAGDVQLSVAREAVGLRSRTLDLVRSRLRTGLATRLDVRRAEGALESARAEVPDAERHRALAANRLALLVGRPPDLAFDGKPPVSFALPPEVPLGIPSSLLERRPDVRAAEARLTAANAAIGVAKADYFPRVTILGRFGYSALDATKLTEQRSSLWQVGPSVSIPIFEGGHTQAAVLEAEARTSEAAALYRDVVLRAFGEVADAIVGMTTREQARDHQAAAVEAEESAVELALGQFRDGLVNSLAVLDAQRSLLAARAALLQSQRELLGELVRLQKALGGGWTAPPRPEDRKD